MAGAGEAIRGALPSPGINQTSFMFGALALAFLFFVTVRGDLPKWIGLLTLPPKASATALPASQNPEAGIPNLPSLSAAPGLGAGAGGMT